MSLENLKKRLADNLIKENRRNNPGKAGEFQLQNVKQVGIFFDSEDKQSYAKMTTLMDFIKKHNITVSAVGYGLSQQQYTQAYFQSYTDEDLNWYGKPKEGNLKDFMNFPFDILFDLTLHDRREQRIILSGAQAKFKVGVDVGSSDLLDFVFEPQKQMADKSYFEQMFEYLNLINIKS